MCSIFKLLYTFVLIVPMPELSGAEGRYASRCTSYLHSLLVGAAFSSANVMLPDAGHA